MCMNPLHRRDAVVERRRKRVLGGEPVVDADHRMVERESKFAADVVMGVETSDHPASAMEVDEGTAILSIVGPIDAKSNTVRVDFGDVVQFDRRGGGHRLHPETSSHWFLGFDRWSSESCEGIENRSCLRVEWHGEIMPRFAMLSCRMARRPRCGQRWRETESSSPCQMRFMFGTCRQIMKTLMPTPARTSPRGLPATS